MSSKLVIHDEGQYEVGKKGAICCGCCFDMRRASILVCILCTIVSALVLAELIGSSDGYSLITGSSSISESEDEDLTESVKAQYFVQGIVTCVGMVTSPLAILGAIRYNAWLIRLQVAWLVANLVTIIVVQIKAAASLQEDLDVDDSEKNQTQWTFLFIAITFTAFCIYPLLGFSREVRIGIMNPEGFRREDYNCCRRYGREQNEESIEDASSPMLSNTKEMIVEREKKSKIRKKNLSLKRMFLLIGFLVIFPIVPIFLSVVFGGILAVAEKAPFLDGFLYVASNLLNMATPLTDFNPNDIKGIIIDIYVTVVSLLTFGIVLNVINVFQVPLFVNYSIGFLVNDFWTPFVALGVVIPFLVAMIAVTFGSLLGWLEGWSIHDGIFYTFSNLLGLGTPLVDVTPTSIAGDLIDIVVSSLALGFVAVFVDYATVLNPARYIRKRLVTFLRSHGVENLDESHPLAVQPNDAITSSRGLQERNATQTVVYAM